MIVAVNYVINNECVSNNEVLCYIFVPFHYTLQTCHCERERQGDVAHGNTRRRAQLGKRRTWPLLVQVYLDSLPCLSMWGMCTNRIILCCFGDKRCKKVATIATYHFKAHLPNNGCVIRNKNYALNRLICT